MYLNICAKIFTRSTKCNYVLHNVRKKTLSQKANSHQARRLAFLYKKSKKFFWRNS